MLDHIDPRLFWAGLTMVWLLVSFAVSLLIGKIIKWTDSHAPRNHYVDDDHVAAMKRTHARNGFKSRQGIR